MQKKDSGLDVVRLSRNDWTGVSQNLSEPARSVSDDKTNDGPQNRRAARLLDPLIDTANALYSNVQQCSEDVALGAGAQARDGEG
jgi:hypothetical protein